MKNSIMWYQPAKLDADDVGLVNGENLNPGTEQQNSFNELYDLSISISDKKRPWHGEINDYHFVKGSLDKIDEKGRILSFDFVARQSCWEEELSKSIKAIGIELSQETRECLKKKNGTNIEIYWILVAAIIIALIIAVVKSLN